MTAGEGALPQQKASPVWRVATIVNVLALPANSSHYTVHHDTWSLVLTVVNTIVVVAYIATDGAIARWAA